MFVSLLLVQMPISIENKSITINADNIVVLFERLAKSQPTNEWDTRKVNSSIVDRNATEWMLNANEHLKWMSNHRNWTFKQQQQQQHRMILIGRKIGFFFIFYSKLYVSCWVSFWIACGLSSDDCKNQHRDSYDVSERKTLFFDEFAIVFYVKCKMQIEINAMNGKTRAHREFSMQIHPKCQLILTID